MGGFYVTHTIRATDREKIGGLLASRKALVSTACSGVVVVYDKDANSQDEDIVIDLARLLSAGMNAVVFAVLNHDDDILMYWLFEGGKQIDSYNSAPDYFADTPEPRGPVGGSARALCEAFASSDIEAAERVLRSGEYVFAFDRHVDLLKALGFGPELAGYSDLLADSFTTGFEESDFAKIGGNP